MVWGQARVGDRDVNAHLGIEGGTLLLGMEVVSSKQRPILSQHSVV